jgi:NADH dehydrogenase FAD-containing subunit
MAAFRPEVLSPTTGRIRIHPTLQVDNSTFNEQEAEDMSHIFACGDCAESGAIQAGHTAYWQGQQAAQNIVKMIANKDVLLGGPLGEYKPTHPAIKVTLGRVSVPVYHGYNRWSIQHNGIISNADGTRMTGEGVEDLSVPVMW